MGMNKGGRIFQDICNRVELEGQIVQYIWNGVI